MDLYAAELMELRKSVNIAVTAIRNLNFGVKGNSKSTYLNNLIYLKGLNYKRSKILNSFSRNH